MTMKRILEEVSSAALVLLLLVNFVSSVGVNVTNSSDWNESLGSSVTQSNTRTSNERYNGSGQPEQPNNAPQSAISLQQKKDARIRYNYNCRVLRNSLST